MASSPTRGPTKKIIQLADVHLFTSFKNPTADLTTPFLDVSK